MYAFLDTIWFHCQKVVTYILYLILVTLFFPPTEQSINLSLIHTPVLIMLFYQSHVDSVTVQNFVFKEKFTLIYSQDKNTKQDRIIQNKNSNLPLLPLQVSLPFPVLTMFNGLKYTFLGSFLCIYTYTYACHMD